MEKGRWTDAIEQERTRTERVKEVIADTDDAEEVMERFWGVDLSVFEDKSVLAVGGGMGYIHAFDNASRRVSLDPLYGEYAINQKDTTVSLIKGAGENVPLSPNSFDCAFSHHVLEHTLNPERIVEAIYESLAPGGEFYLQILVSPLPKFARKLLAEKNILRTETAHPFMPSRSKVEDLLERIGFTYEVTYNQPTHGTAAPLDFQAPLTSMYYKVKRQRNFALIATKPKQS